MPLKLLRKMTGGIHGIPEYFEIMSDLGFEHVRLPVRWEPANRSMSIPPYTIDESFLNRIKLVVDVALENKLHIIVNMLITRLCSKTQLDRKIGLFPNGAKLLLSSRITQIPCFLKYLMNLMAI